MAISEKGAAAAAPSVLELEGISKAFGSVLALRNGSIRLAAGSIHALVGENGAGKSTLVKIIAGLYRRDAGEFRLGGESVDFGSTAESKAAGIAVIYQEPTLFPDLSVTENIFMGRQPTRAGRIDRRAMRAEAVAIFERLGVRIDPDRPTLGLSIADQQIIEIAKAISLDASVLIMDEPTAALSGVEVERLFAVARSLRDEGRALVFISHRFDEVFALCDTITVMRDGEYIATHATADVTVPQIVRDMVGREVSELFPKTEGVQPGRVVLAVEHLTSAGTFHDISFEVREREIVGLAGLVGAGRSEVARAIFGVDRYDSGSVTVDGAALPVGDSAAAIEAGLAFIPEDRRRQGLVVEMSIARNITITLRRALSRFGLLTRDPEYAAAREWSERLQVKAGTLDSEAGTLSGGNQQKVVIAKWLATNPRLLIIDEPTRGIDVGTKAEVHRLLDRLAQQGMAVLMISSELPEVLGMSDRVLVMREGEITAELARAEADSEAVMTAATRSGVAA
ncbi:MAG: sugar ABC transporter ATP-binding protein [Microbacteriaceae bacterium]